jgi:hypothetical protein
MHYKAKTSLHLGSSSSAGGAAPAASNCCCRVSKTRSLAKAISSVRPVDVKIVAGSLDLGFRRWDSHKLFMQLTETIPFFIVCVIVLFAGLCFLIYPDKIRKYDNRMTRFVPNKDEYFVAVRLMGTLLIVGAGIGVLFLIALLFASKN